MKKTRNVRARARIRNYKRNPVPAESLGGKLFASLGEVISKSKRVLLNTTSKRVLLNTTSKAERRRPASDFTGRLLSENALRRCAGFAIGHYLSYQHDCGLSADQSADHADKSQSADERGFVCFWERTLPACEFIRFQSAIERGFISTLWKMRNPTRGCVFQSAKERGFIPTTIKSDGRVNALVSIR